jgi:hypothetical protein
MSMKSQFGVGYVLAGVGVGCMLATGITGDPPARSLDTLHVVQQAATVSTSTSTSSTALTFAGNTIFVPLSSAVPSSDTATLPSIGGYVSSTAGSS